jgi:hypothetical protein
MADFATTTNSNDGIEVLSQAISERIGVILESRLFPAILTEVEKKSKAALQTKESYTKKFENFGKALEDKGWLGVGYDALKKRFGKNKEEKAEPVKQATDALKLPSVKETQEKLPSTIKDNEGFTQRISATEADVINEVNEKPKTVIIGGLTEGFEKKLPEILKGIFPKEKTEEEKEKEEDYSEGGLLGSIPGWVKGLGGGLALILGGITALVMAFKTDGGAKGTLELIGKAGIKGGLVLLAKKVFGMTLKSALKRIPIIGTLISYGFAFQRFSKGDTIGGIIDLVSGTVQLLDLVAPGLGTVLSLGVDIMQAVLDAKTGGSSAEASAKKGSMLLDWAKGLGKMIYKGVKYIPVVGPLIQMAEDISKGKWVDAMYSLVRSIPGVGTVLDIIDYFTEGKTQESIKGGISKATNWVTGFGKWVASKVINLPIIGPLIKSSQALFAGQWKDSLIWLGRAVPFVGMIMDWLDVKTSDEKKDIKQETPKKSPFTAIKDAILEKARNWWKNTWTWVKWLARKVLPANVIKSLEDNANEKLEGIDTPVGEVKLETSPLDNLKKVGGVIADKVKDWASTNVKAMADKITNFTKSTVTNAIDGAKKFKEKVTSAFSVSKDWVKDQTGKFAEAYKSVTETVTDIGKWVHENITKRIFNFVKDTIKNTFKFIKDSVGGIWSKLTSFMSGSEDISEQLKQTNIPTTKTGTEQNNTSSVNQSQDLSVNEIDKRDENAKQNLNVQPETNQIRTAENIQQTDERPINIDATDTPVIDERFLRDISDNTEKTHMSLENLIRLMYKFTQVLDKKMLPDGQQGPRVLLGQQQEYESASRAAATNFDPIRHVRSQFTLDTA